MRVPRAEIRLTSGATHQEESARNAAEGDAMTDIRCQASSTLGASATKPVRVARTSQPGEA